jgi:transcription initiation factor IIE alpha subunit
MASGCDCGYEFVCPICKQSLYHDNTSKLIETMQAKIDELKTDAQAIFYAENLAIFERAQAEQE